MEEEISSRLAICVLKNQNISSKEVVQELDKHGIHYSIRGIDNAYQQYQERGTHLTNRSNCGRKKIDEKMEEEILQHFKQNQSSLRSFQRDKELNPTNLTIVSISRILNRNGLYSYKLSQTLLLTEEHRQEQLKFARKVARWRGKLKEIVFQDETHFELETYGQTHTWTESRNLINSQIGSKMNSYSQKIYLLGMIHYEGGLKLFRSTQKIDDLQEKTLCLDLARFHSAKNTVQWLEENSIDYLFLPPKRADINLIENVWSILKAEVFKQKESINTLDDLYEIAKREFYSSQKIKDSIKNAYLSLPKRIAQIISKNNHFYQK